MRRPSAYGILWVAALIILTGLHSLASAQSGTIEDLRRALENPTLERLSSGYQFVEGPAWVPGLGLLFSDIPANRIYHWVAGSTVTVWREPSGQSNGLLVDQHGRVIACEHGNRRVSRTEADGRVITLADRFEGKRLNSPNDAAVAHDGSIYFTDPPYGVAPQDRELDFQGVYRIPPGGGAIQLLVDDFDRPNGIGLSPDGRTLYVQDSARIHCRAFDVQPDGSITNNRIFAPLSGPGGGVPDGMTVDQLGNVYLTAAGGVWVFSATGEQLGIIRVPETTANCGFGDEDRKGLFLTASNTLYRVRLPIPGIVEEAPAFLLY